MRATVVYLRQPQHFPGPNSIARHERYYRRHVPEVVPSGVTVDLFAQATEPEARRWLLAGAGFDMDIPTRPRPGCAW